MITTFTTAVHILDGLLNQYEGLSAYLTPIMSWVTTRQAIVRKEIDTILEDLEGGISGGGGNGGLDMVIEEGDDEDV